jgi:hypothetical protein
MRNNPTAQGSVVRKPNPKVNLKFKANFLTACLYICKYFFRNLICKRKAVNAKRKQLISCCKVISTLPYLSVHYNSQLSRYVGLWDCIQDTPGVKQALTPTQACLDFLKTQ